MWVLYLFLLLLYLAYLAVAVPLAMVAATIFYTFGVPVSYLRGLAAMLARRAGRPSPRTGRSRPRTAIRRCSSTSTGPPGRTLPSRSESGSRSARSCGNSAVR